MTPSAGTPEQRGYGADHQRLRRQWVRTIREHGGWHCARGSKCKHFGTPRGTLILPDEPFDLGHDDHNRNLYSGPEHPECNRATAGRKKPKPPPLGTPSRDW